MKHTVFLLAALLLAPLAALHAADTSKPGPGSVTAAAAARLEIRRFQPEQPISRARRPAPVTATVINLGEADVTARANLSLPGGVRVLRTNADKALRLASDDGEETLRWELEAEGPLAGELRLELTVDGRSVARQSLAMNFLPALEMRKLPYIPEPKPVPTDRLVGAHHCPLWESDKPNMWLNVLKHPERTPALGFYSQENPEVADWETKWAVEHGISFFIYCWYVPGSPTPEQAIRAQMEYIRKTQELDTLPQVVTVSQAWSGWHDEGTIWKIPPPDFERLLRQAKEFTATLPAQELGHRLLLLDNWNECRVKTDRAGQDNKWILNRVFGGDTTSGYRLGVLEGMPCFQIPLTAWSHHLKAAEPLPTGRWVHLAATFDGQIMSLYVDGTERGAMERPGPIRPNAFHLVLGNYEVDHAAYFAGLLDDVRLYHRTLTPEEIRRNAAGRPEER